MPKEMARISTHPGEVLLQDVIIPLGLSITAAASFFDLPYEILDNVVHCRTDLTPTLADHIARATKTTPESWIQMQANFNNNSR